MYLKYVSYSQYRHHLSKHDIHQEMLNIKIYVAMTFLFEYIVTSIDKFDELNFTATQIVQVHSICTR